MTRRTTTSTAPTPSAGGTPGSKRSTPAVTPDPADGRAGGAAASNGDGFQAEREAAKGAATGAARGTTTAAEAAVPPETSIGTGAAAVAGTPASARMRISAASPPATHPAAAAEPAATSESPPTHADSAAAARTAGAATAPPPLFPVPESVLRARTETDWDGFLPDRAERTGWRVGQAVKRGLDTMLAGAALVALAPVFAVLAVVVKTTSPGPIFFPWKVLGRHGRPFVGYKFRTMVADAEARKRELLGQNEMTGPVFKMREDPRVTRVGRWLRRYSLDELPQLWSVLKGDMSLVGPRPPGPDEFAAFEPWQRGKLAVTPGITCLWQVNGRSHITDFGDWAKLDLEYIRRWSLWLDLKILLRTIPAVLRGDGAY